MRLRRASCWIHQLEEWLLLLLGLLAVESFGVWVTKVCIIIITISLRARWGVDIFESAILLCSTTLSAVPSLIINLFLVCGINFGLLKVIHNLQALVHATKFVKELFHFFLIAHSVHPVCEVWNLEFWHGLKVPTPQNLHHLVKITDFVPFPLELQVLIRFNNCLPVEMLEPARIVSHESGI